MGCGGGGDWEGGGGVRALRNIARGPVRDSSLFTYGPQALKPLPPRHFPQNRENKLSFMPDIMFWGGGEGDIIGRLTHLFSRFCWPAGWWAGLAWPRVFPERPAYAYEGDIEKMLKKSSLHCKKMVTDFPVPSWDVTNQTLPDQE